MKEDPKNQLKSRIRIQMRIKSNRIHNTVFFYMKGWYKIWSLRVWFDMHIAHIYLQRVGTGTMYNCTGGGRENQGGKIGTILPAIPRNPSPHA
jgi:hypothetical protein